MTVLIKIKNFVVTKHEKRQIHSEILKHFSVLQGLMEIKSPYVEELLSLLMTVRTQNGTAGPVAMVISLLLQDSDERAVKKEVDVKR